MRTGLLAALLLALPAQAQTRCTDAQTQAQMNECAARDLRAAEGRMTQAYNALRTGLTPAHQAKLADAQRAWTAFRAAHCNFEGLEVEGGSMQPMVVAFCMAQATEARTRQLLASAR
jgi:uncharacterized protein YecT (DUF1311 family)